MPPPLGGVRDRLILDNLFRLIVDSLTTLGWFDAGREHGTIYPVPKPVDDHDEIQFNTLAVSCGDTEIEYGEIGSFLEIRRTPWWVDFYAESDAVGKHLIGDVRDIIGGKLAGRTAPTLDVYDYRLATPSVVFACELDEISDDRARGFTQEHRRHWYECSFTVIDTVTVDD